MGKTKYGTRYPDELRARAVRMVLDHEREYASRSAAVLSISQKVACSGDSLRIWVKQYETDTGQRDDVTSVERNRIKELERENRQPRQANKILKRHLLTLHKRSVSYENLGS
ncbi:transposase [Rhodobacteraceae bacterium R_SAG5]|nr:transposase [Tritonibacter mobilis]MCZ4270138.1 transposase [Rhodobacteraceae bacterium G21628-S1]NKX39705.1 transposase [Rhodobacteraceae bacterium R_SAG5]NKX75921.1 transposase [Rhodobacteraceae bacterium R_SAG3]